MVLNIFVLPLHVCSLSVSLLGGRILLGAASVRYIPLWVCRGFNSNTCWGVGGCWLLLCSKIDIPLLLVQAVLMFMGEMCCFIAFKVWYYSRVARQQDISIFGPQKFNPLVWAIPAMCDLAGTSTMYLALTWTYAASFQMLRGSVIIFTGILSVTFLGNKLKWNQWLGMFIVIVGLSIVGTGDYVFFSGGGHLSKSMVLAGDLLIVLAQGIAAVQMTVEEKIIRKYKVPPLQGVGWEGIFGFSVLVILLVPMFFVPWHLPSGQDFFQDHTRFEDAIDGLAQMKNNWQLAFANLGLIVSIAFFNFSGLTITEKMNATTRMVLDSVRTIFIWAFSLAIGWQKFEYLQPIGYAVLFVGTCIYYDLIFMPAIRYVLGKRYPQYKQYKHHVQDRNGEKKPLIHPSPINDESEEKLQ